jgi:hypothetical protein
VLDGVHMVWTDHLEKFLEMVYQLLRRVLEVTLSSRDVLLVRVIYFLVVLGAFLSAFVGGFG